MNRNKIEENCGEGRLPASAPLVNPYVPFQLDNPPRYERRKALVRGTLYPGLDLPLLGMVNKNEKPVTPLTELQSVAFAIQELALYLDTHRDDKEALEVYEMYKKMHRECKKAYEEQFGPLNHFSENPDCYAWLDDPWPWEYAKNREV